MMEGLRERTIIKRNRDMPLGRVFTGCRSRLRERAAAHVARVIRRCGENGFPELCVLLYEGRNEGVEEAEHVVTHQDLTVAVRTGADADGWDCEAGRDGRRNRIG